MLSYDPDGKNEKIVATGLRNCAGVTIQPATGLPWCVVNERDELGDNTPFEYATAVKDSSFYGWPWYYIGSNEDPRHKGARPDLKGKVTVPDVLMQAHSAPLQIVFYEGNDFPASYKGSAFVALHGSWNRAERTGYKVVRLLFDSAGKPTGEYEDFLTGFVISDKQVWGRPVGVAVAKDGSLFVTEDGNGHDLARQPSEGRVQQLTGSGSSAADADEHPRTTDRKAQAMTIKAINPATGEAFASYQEMTDDRLRDAISKAHNEFLDWRRTGFSSRAGLMRQAAKVLRENAGKYADLMAREMGKPIRDGVAEVQKCAAACDYYADNAERFLAAEPIKTEARKSYVIFQPLGVVLAVMPWNFPFWQVFRFAAPGLMAATVR